MATLLATPTYSRVRPVGDVDTLQSTTSWYIGGEGQRYRIVGYKFKTPATGIVSLSFELYVNSYQTWVSGNTSSTAGEKLRYKITTSTTAPKPSDAADGTMGGNNGRIYSSGTITKVLTPNTDYYLWIYSSEYYNFVWEVANKQPTITYNGGVANIKTSSGWKKAIPWIKTSSGWKQAIPWILHGGSWKNTC